MSFSSEEYKGGYRRWTRKNTVWENKFADHLKERVHRFSKTLGNPLPPPQNSGCHKGYMQQVLYYVSTNVRRQRTKFGRHGDLVPKIYDSLCYGL